jgi:hypothetical protein
MTMGSRFIANWSYKGCTWKQKEESYAVEKRRNRGTVREEWMNRREIGFRFFDQMALKKINSQVVLLSVSLYTLHCLRVKTCLHVRHHFPFLSFKKNWYNKIFIFIQLSSYFINITPYTLLLYVVYFLYYVIFLCFMFV